MATYFLGGSLFQFLSFFFLHSFSFSLFHHWEIGIFLLEQKGIGEEKQKLHICDNKEASSFFLSHMGAGLRRQSTKSLSP